MKPNVLQRAAPVLVLVGAVLLYALISLVNHVNFRTYALDLGYYTHGLYQYSRLRWARELMIHGSRHWMLGDHFDLYLPILSPLRYVLGTRTLLWVQMAALALGGVGVYRYARERLGNRPEALRVMALYSFFFGILSALAFDYHSVAVAAGLLPWWWVFFVKSRWAWAWGLWILILAAQENVALTAGFLALGRSLQTSGSPTARRAAFWMAVAAFLWFGLVVGWLIPHLNPKGSYPLFWYSALGSSPADAFHHVIRHPLDSLKIWFINHSGQPAWEGIKTETWLFLCCAGLPFVLLSGPWRWALLPLLGQKFWHDLPMVWSVHGQYNVELAPVFALGITDFLASRPSAAFRRGLGWLLLCCNVGVSVRLMDRTVAFSDKSRIRWYALEHYSNPRLPVRRVHFSLSQLPPAASVSAQSPFVPHLALRDSVFQFPLHYEKCRFIVFSQNENPYPLDTQNFQNLTRRLLDSGAFEIQTHDAAFYVLRRK